MARKRRGGQRPPGSSGGGEEPNRARLVTRILRTVRIGPRLLLSIIVAPLLLLALVGVLSYSDISALQDLRRFSDSTEEIRANVEIRSALQIERDFHSQTTTITNSTDIEMTQDDLDFALREIGFVGGAAFVEDLQQARLLVANNREFEAALLYDDLIAAIEEDIAVIIETAPLGLAEQRANAFKSLLAGEELLRREDLETRRNQIDPIRLNALHTSAITYLSLFSEEGSQTAIGDFEAITISDSWRQLNLIRQGSFDSVRQDRSFDRLRWEPAAADRTAALNALVDSELGALQTDIETAVDSEVTRLTVLAAFALIVIVLAMLIAESLRRSITSPLSNLTISARLLARGEPAHMTDFSPDEIGEMSRAFTSISSTMDQLWKDVNTVSGAISAGDYGKRIVTNDLAGDWLRFAETMNSTLATGEEHRTSEREELDRRGTVASISSDAAVATTARQLTAAVLEHLPSAVSGSTAHLHRHPSGPPTVNLGVNLEPSISALELPSSARAARAVDLGDRSGIASLVEFPEGPPAVLVLAFGDHEPSNIDPLLSLIDTAAQILAQAHRRQAAESRAHHISGHDLLTGLPNSEYARHWFIAEADRSIPWSIIGVQPQRLNELDGLLGRSNRDELLRSTAVSLAAVVGRVIDDTDTDLDFEAVLARITDPDFAVIAPAALRDRLTEALAARFEEPFIVNGVQIDLGATIAYDEVSLDDRDLTQAVTNVSAAIAQASGRKVEVLAFEDSHREKLARRSIIIDWLSHAIANNDLFVHFQPIVNAITMSTEGYEVLVRGKMNGDPIAPDEFISVAEETGMIAGIGEFVLQEACAALPFLKGHRPYVAVNLSPVQLLSPTILVDVERILTAANAQRSRVVFEITEGATVTPESLSRITELRELGVKIAIDDFGSGQSNLSYLNKLPAQILKLDRSLVTPMVHDRGAATLVEKTVEMAHAMDMTVIGEGVEDLEELNALRRVFCDRIQGWYTGKPGPLEQFIEITVDQAQQDRNSVRNQSGEQR